MVLNLTAEQVEGDLREALPNLELRHVNERLAELGRLSVNSGLTPEEEAQMSALTRRRLELDQARTGSPPVL